VKKYLNQKSYNVKENYSGRKGNKESAKQHRRKREKFLVKTKSK